MMSNTVTSSRSLHSLSIIVFLLSLNRCVLKGVHYGVLVLSYCINCHALFFILTNISLLFPLPPPSFSFLPSLPPLPPFLSLPPSLDNPELADIKEEEIIRVTYQTMINHPLNSSLLQVLPVQNMMIILR